MKNQQAPVYRWNTSAAAEAFDRAAEFIHPLYLTVQEEVIRQLPFAMDEEFLLVDLGAGSGRLVERVLKQFSKARAVLVDQSEPFLGIAERKLQPFGERVSFVQRRLQDDWQSELPAAPNAIVSMSAIHHLESSEKGTLFARCYEVLADDGVFVNGDEYRPEGDAGYRALLDWWWEQKNVAEAEGKIPTSFRPVFDAWYERNIRRFGEPKKSGEDCLETVAAQAQCLQSSGFASVRSTWEQKLWAVLVARKALAID